MSTSPLRLDDLYKMIAHIYGEQNAHRRGERDVHAFLGSLRNAHRPFAQQKA